jgi:TonB-linked SusC/RagA family outer membrane protein
MNNSLQNRRFREKKRHTVKIFSILTAIMAVISICSASAALTQATEKLQQKTTKVSGTVWSKEDGEPIAGANVLIEGTTMGVITDENGMFTLSGVPAGAKTVKISYIGMSTQTLPLQSDMTVWMESDVKLMDEVIVVSYGTAKKSSFTGSANQIRAERFESRPLTNITNALLGSTPGVQVSTANGQPGSEPSIYIRGIGSFSAGNTPLIVLNGMPYDNAISSINPGDIESITVLKDASSAALYGARAGNGVILINTKTGSRERLTVNVKINQGITARQNNDYKTLGIEDYLLVYWESWRNKRIGNGEDPATAGENAARYLITDDLIFNPFNVPDDQVVDMNGKLNPNARFMWADDTDWTRAIQQLGNRTEAGVNISGGNSQSDYYLSVGYLSEKGYIIGSQFDRYTMNTNINTQITPFLKVGGTLSANIGKSLGEQNEASGGNTNPFRFTRYIGPIYPIHIHHPETKDRLLDPNGHPIYDFGNSIPTADGLNTPTRPYIGGNNPVIELQNLYNGFKRNTLNAKAYTEIRLPAGFKLTLNGAVGANAYLASSAAIVYPEKGNTGSASKTNTFTTTWTFNELLSYTADFNLHHVDALLGHESYSYEYNNFSGSMQDQKVRDDNYELGNYSTPGLPGSYTNRYRTEGYLLRLNYDYGNRYFLSVSARRDGSSRFYKDARWGNFYSIGAGWRIDGEKFMDGLTFVDLLKLRASYGEVGNDDIGTYYAWQASYEASTNGLEPGYIRERVLNNRSLQWEVSRNSDIALEFELFNQRLGGSVEYFNRQSSNLLFSIPQSPSAGLTAAYRNAGDMYNRGVEIDLNGKPVKTKDLTWSLGINATFLKNKITSLPVDPYNSSMHRIEEGHSRYEFYLRQWAGVDPATGNTIYIPDGEKVTDEEIAAYDHATPEERKELTIAKIGDRYYTTEVAKALYDWSGVSTPVVSGGFTTTVHWKGFSLNLLFNYQLGGKMYDSGYGDLMVGPSGSALPGSTRHRDILRRWQKEGDITDVPRIEDFGNANMNAGTSTRWLISSDMLELANVTLSYDVHGRWIRQFKIHGLRLYASGDNLLLFTKRQGIYPRRNIFSGYSGNPDVYLPARVFTAGLNLSF